MTIEITIEGLPVTIEVPGDLSDDDYNQLMCDVDSIVEMFIQSYAEDGDGYTVESVDFSLNEAGTELRASCYAVNKDTGKTSFGDVTTDVQIKILEQSETL